MEDFLAFRRMITPVIIQFLFWIGVIGLVIAGILGIIQGTMPLWTSLAVLILGPIAIRIYAELLILFFRMNETLTEIKNNTEHRSQ